MKLWVVTYVNVERKKVEEGNRDYERCKESYENNLYDNDDYQCDNLTPEQTMFYDVFDIRFLVRHAGTSVYGSTYVESIWYSGGEAFVTEKYKTSITNKGNTGGIPIKSTKPVAVVILGVSIASNEELFRLVKRIESDALDDVISELTTAEHDATHALVLKLARGIDYVNSDSDTPSEEPNRVTPSVVSHIDESPIVRSVSIQDKPSSYIGAV
nr:hypothetical protein [Tanacetum cinerariifolium]